jgi:hypothetical protein
MGIALAAAFGAAFAAGLAADLRAAGDFVVLVAMVKAPLRGEEK